MCTPQDLPLRRKWVWRNHLKVKRARMVDTTYEKTYLPLCDVATIGEFWQVYNNFPFPGKVVQNRAKVCVQGSEFPTCGVSLFVEGFEPSWECFGGTHDGCVEFTFSAHDDDKVDRFWMQLVLHMVGEAEPQEAGVDTDMLIGVRLVDKTYFKETHNTYRIEVWCTLPSAAAISGIEKNFEKLCHLLVAESGGKISLSQGVRYVPHADKSGTNCKVTLPNKVPFAASTHDRTRRAHR